VEYSQSIYCQANLRSSKARDLLTTSKFHQLGRRPEALPKKAGTDPSWGLAAQGNSLEMTAFVNQFQFIIFFRVTESDGTGRYNSYNRLLKR
jgi:hypothetical protein